MHMSLGQIIAEKISPNLISIPLAEAANADPTFILENEAFSYYRSGKDRVIFRKKEVPPSHFYPEDNGALNNFCEQEEGRLNKAVKKELALALIKHFNGLSFHLMEFGCGFFPLVHHFGSKARLSYQGIEVDENCIRELHEMNVPAANWEHASELGLPEGKDTIAASVYAMHFMVNNEFADRIKKLTSDNGFFVGNFYSDPAEKVTGNEKQRLRAILKENNLFHIVLKNASAKKDSSEYWIIGKASSVTSMKNFARVMQDNSIKVWRRELITGEPNIS